jgi:predicted nucleotide-binding protein
LAEAIRSQKIVGGDGAAAAALAGVIVLRELATGDILITQGGEDNDLYLIVSGALEVRINGRAMAKRTAGNHVGEMALVDPSARRSATVVALEPTLVGKVSEPAFCAIAEQHPRLWRAIAIEVGERLRQRSRFVTPPNDQPIVFIGSSSEALPVAELTRGALQSPDLELRLWTDGVFTASRFPMEDLETQLAAADFAILVVAPDDVVASRGKRAGAPRDNVVFELGLFMGAISRTRTFMIVPRDADTKIPTDLLGLTPLHYASAAPNADIHNIGKTLRAMIRKQGPR